MNVRRRILTVFFYVLGAMGLAGCVTPASHFQAGLQDGVLAFVDCQQAGGVDTIRVSVTDVDGGADTEVWKASGAGEFGPNDVIQYGEAPNGFTTDVGPAHIDLSAQRISAFLAGFSGGVRYSDSINFRGMDLAEGYWIDAEGSVSSAPCD